MWNYNIVSSKKRYLLKSSWIPKNLNNNGENRNFLLAQGFSAEDHYCTIPIQILWGRG